MHKDLPLHRHFKERALSLALKLTGKKELSSERGRLILITGDLLAKEWLQTASQLHNYHLYALFYGDQEPSFLQNHLHQLPKEKMVPCSHAELCRIAQIPQRQKAPISMILEMQDLGFFSFEEPLPNRVLVMDGASDPGNVGTLLRSAESFGFSTVIALEGTCDMHSPKVFSAARGSHFRLKLFKSELSAMELFFEQKADLEEKAQLIAASCHGNQQLLNRLGNSQKPLFLILGHEKRGVSPSLEKRAQCVKIPTAPPVDSLNVAIAGSILMHHLSPLTHE